MIVINKVLAFICIGVPLSGCATIVRGTTQSISVTTTPTTGARCVLQNKKGAWHLTSPATITIHKADGHLDISCTKMGFADASKVISGHLDGVTFVGGPAGVGIDAADGALFTYPKEIDVPMTPTTSAQASPPT
jgi:uncharacterized protein YceK